MSDIDIVLFHAKDGLWLWGGLAAALLAIEVMTGSGWLLWPAASAAVVAILTRAFGLSLEAAVLTFAALTLVTTVIARRYLPSRLLGRHGHDINDNSARLVGHHGQVVAAFKGRLGRVFIDGKEWAAELEAGEPLEPGAEVEVTGVAGARLKVKAP